MKLCEIIGGRAVLLPVTHHVDLIRAPYALYGVQYIDLVSLLMKLCSLRYNVTIRYK